MDSQSGLASLCEALGATSTPGRGRASEPPVLTHVVEAFRDSFDGAFVYALRRIDEQPEILDRHTPPARIVAPELADQFQEWMGAYGLHLDRKWTMVGLTDDQAFALKVTW